MSLQTKWFRDYKDRIIYAVVLVTGCGMLVVGFSGGGFEWWYFGAAAILLSWIAWEREEEYLQWARRRVQHKTDVEKEPQNEYPSDTSPANESSVYVSGPRFTCFPGNSSFWFSDETASARSPWLEEIVLHLLLEPTLLLWLFLAITFALLIVMLPFLIGAFRLIDKHPIVVIAVASVITIAVFFRDRIFVKK